MSNGLAVIADNSKMIERIEQVVMTGNLAGLNPQERMFYYRQVCERVGLNPLSQPFEYLTLSGKLTLYAKKSCKEQLRAMHDISIEILSQGVEMGEFYVVRGRASKPGGRFEDEVGSVWLKKTLKDGTVEDLKGEEVANAIQKAVTRMKGRATLALCHISMMDESEVEGLPGAHIEVTPQPKQIVVNENFKTSDFIASEKQVEPPPVDQSEAERAAKLAKMKSTLKERILGYYEKLEQFPDNAAIEGIKEFPLHEATYDELMNWGKKLKARYEGMCIKYPADDQPEPEEVPATFENSIGRNQEGYGPNGVWVAPDGSTRTVPNPKLHHSAPVATDDLIAEAKAIIASTPKSNATWESRNEERKTNQKVKKATEPVVSISAISEDVDPFDQIVPVKPIGGYVPSK